LKLRIWLTRLALPIIKAITHLGKPEPECNYFDYQSIKQLSQPGDIIVCREDFRLSNILIKGFWSHVGIVVDNHHVLEALPPKVRAIHLSQFVLSKDHVCLLRPRWRIEYKNIVHQYLGRLYDFEFLGDNEEWYCAELVFDYLRVISRDFPLGLRLVWGIETIIPEDFYLANKKFINLYEKRS